MAVAVAVAAGQMPPPGPLALLHPWKRTCFAWPPVQMSDKETGSH